MGSPICGIVRNCLEIDFLDGGNEESSFQDGQGQIEADFLWTQAHLFRTGLEADAALDVDAIAEFFADGNEAGEDGTVLEFALFGIGRIPSSANSIPLRGDQLRFWSATGRLRQERDHRLSDVIHRCE